MKTAAGQLGLISRRQALEAGMTSHQIQNRRRAGWWSVVHPGVYLLGAGSLTWAQRCLAACLLADSAALSHRAALVLWGLDGLAEAPVELTVPHGTEIVAERLLVHRSRRWAEVDRTRHGGIPVSVVPRSLVDCGRYLGPRQLEKALESALRRRLTNEAEVFDYLEHRAGSLPGARVLRQVVLRREPGRAVGSAAEAELFMALRSIGAPTPERQHAIRLGNGAVAVVDGAWPGLRFGFEVDGFDFHGGRQAHSADLERQNGILAAGWDLRRYSGSQVMASPTGIARSLLAELSARAAQLGVSLQAA